VKITLAQLKVLLTATAMVFVLLWSFALESERGPEPVCCFWTKEVFHYLFALHICMTRFQSLSLHLLFYKVDQSIYPQMLKLVSHWPKVLASQWPKAL
jgi:hypothetical protein